MMMGSSCTPLNDEDAVELCGVEEKQGVWEHRLKNRVDDSSIDRDDRRFRLIVGRRTSAIDEKNR
jgi:hypothetical protein